MKIDLNLENGSEWKPWGAGVHKRMHRFTLRTKPKVDVQWRLFALVHNIGKIHVFGALT